MKDNNVIKDTVKKLSEFCAESELFACEACGCLVSKSAIIDIVENLRKILFPVYVDGIKSMSEYDGQAELILTGIEKNLTEQCFTAFKYSNTEKFNDERLKQTAENAVSDFISSLPHIQQMLAKDVTALYNGDPAAKTKAEIIISYPGLFAIFVYRTAHLLYKNGVPMIPRIMTEYAHSLTGIDINSGAEIGEYFFIDHGTGVVIGETTVIGNNVKLYQGVTLGALSTRKGHMLTGVKRHPTICDDVTIYSDATILGGDTVIGKGAVIGGNAFIIKSVPAGTKVTV